MAASFEISGMEDDPLGLWQPAVSTAATVPGAVSFSLDDDPSTAAPEPADPVFRVNLPADAASAFQALADRENYLRSLSAAFETVPARLDDLVTRTQERQQKSASEGVSFDSSQFDQPVETGPEGDLLSLLDDVKAEEKAQGDVVSFGIPEPASEALEQAKAGLNALLEQISREVLHFAWVETNVAGQLLARTTVGWTGDAETAFFQGVTDPEVILHTRNLHIVTQTRSLRLQLFITIATGATKISVLLATPTGSLLALPAVYRYVMQIVKQVKQLQSIQST